MSPLVTIRELVPDFDLTTLVYLVCQVVLLVIVAVYLWRASVKQRRNERAEREQQAASQALIDKELDLLRRGNDHMQRVEAKLDRIISLLSDLTKDK